MTFIPMSDSTKDSLRHELSDLHEECDAKSSAIESIIRAANKNTTIIEGFGFEIEIYSAMPGPLKEMVATMSENIEKLSGVEAYREEIKVTSVIMANMCVDEDLKSTDAWIRFENETGLLRDIAEVVVKSSTAKPEDVKNFRRKSKGASAVRTV